MEGINGKILSFEFENMKIEIMTADSHRSNEKEG